MMDKMMITVEQVLNTAFSPTERVDDEIVSETLIRTAQMRFLKPPLNELYEVLDSERYVEFFDRYLKTPLAYYVKYLVIGQLSTQVGSMGLMQLQGGNFVPTSVKGQARMCRQTLKIADTWMRVALDYVRASPEQFPEYDATADPACRVSLRGGFVLRQ